MAVRLGTEQHSHGPEVAYLVWMSQLKNVSILSMGILRRWDACGQIKWKNISSAPALGLPGCLWNVGCCWSLPELTSLFLPGKNRKYVHGTCCSRLSKIPRVPCGAAEFHVLLYNSFLANGIRRTLLWFKKGGKQEVVPTDSQLLIQQDSAKSL